MVRLLAIYTILSKKPLPMIIRGVPKKKLKAMKGQANQNDLLNTEWGALRDKLKECDSKGCDEIEKWGDSLLTSSGLALKKILKIPASCEAIKMYKGIKKAKDLERMKKPKDSTDFQDFIATMESLCQNYLQSWCNEEACQKFYACFEAKTYIMTSGRGPYYHPDMEVLNGIAKAAIDRCQCQCQCQCHCQIVLTNSVGLELWKFSDVFFKHKDKVSVWYLDDAKEKLPSRLPCVTIDPLQKLYVHQDQNEVKSKV